MSTPSLTIEPFSLRDNGGGSLYVVGPADYMQRRGVDLCWDLSQGDYREDFRRERSSHGGTLLALATFILADWAENPGIPGGFCGCTVNFRNLRRFA